MLEIVATLGVHPTRPDRWAVISPAGVVMNWLDLASHSRDEVAADLVPALARAGLELRDDNTIVRAADLAAPIALVDPTLGHPRRVGHPEQQPRQNLPRQVGTGGR